MIALDLRGHGASDKPHAASKYGAEMAADVVRLLDHLKIAKAHLVGYSMGAFVAGKVVEKNPGRVISVVYGGSSPVLHTRAVKGFSDADLFAQAVKSGKGLGSYLMAVAPEMKLSLESANRLTAQMFAKQDVKALAAAGQSFERLAVDAKRLAKSAIPTLLIHGSGESKYVLDRVAEAKLALPWATVKVIQGPNHITTLVHPEFGASIVSFLEANRL